MPSIFLVSFFPWPSGSKFCSSLQTPAACFKVNLGSGSIMEHAKLTKRLCAAEKTQEYPMSRVESRRQESSISSESQEEKRERAKGILERHRSSLTLRSHAGAPPLLLKTAFEPNKCDGQQNCGHEQPETIPIVSLALDRIPSLTRSAPPISLYK